MKKIFILLVIFTFAVFNLSATVRTVSNSAKNPAQFTSINAAVTVSSPGDTILVFGSNTSYGDATLDRTIVLIGAGCHNNYGGNSIINTLTLNGSGAFNASNSKISGFKFNNVYFYGTNGAAKKIENVVIERCQIGYTTFYHGDVTYRNDTIRNCYVEGSYLQFSSGTYDNIQIHNNIFDNEYFYSNSSKSLNTVKVSNNVFLNRTSPNTVFYQCKDLVVNNNIFYAAEPQGCTDCAFNNNMTFANNNNVLTGPSSNNPNSVGTNNQENIDPQFVNYPIGGGAYTWTYNLNVQNPLAINHGTDNTDMGIHGGMLPYTPGANPAIPQMTEITFPGNASSVKVGGTLNVTFKASKQD